MGVGVLYREGLPVEGGFVNFKTCKVFEVT